MNKQLEIHNRLHGKHICQHPGYNTLAMGSFCLVHIESAIARQWEQVNDTAEDPRQTGENENDR
jgi:hypothetical protein